MKRLRLARPRFVKMYDDDHYEKWSDKESERAYCSLTIGTDLPEAEIEKAIKFWEMHLWARERGRFKKTNQVKRAIRNIHETPKWSIEGWLAYLKRTYSRTTVWRIGREFIHHAKKCKQCRRRLGKVPLKYLRHRQ